MKNRIVKLLATALVTALVAQTGSMYAQQSSMIVRRYAPNTAPVRINEIAPDPAGADTLGREYLELVNTSGQAQDLTGWQIKNAQGRSLHVFSATTIPSGAPPDRFYVTVYFGPVVPSMVDDDFFDGDHSTVAFSGRGNALDNDQDCIYLEDATGRIVDAVIYGAREPSGPGRDAVRNGGFWVGIRMNTNFGDGAIPITEGGIIGRNLDSDDYDSARDWRVDGGANALGYTIGARNHASAFDDVGDSIWVAQAIVNDAIGIFAGYNQGYVQVIDASNSNNVISDPGLGGGYSVASDHQITIQDMETGQSEVMSGRLIVTYERAAGSSFDLSLTGTISGSRHSLDVDVSESHTGFGTITHGIDSTFNFTWHKDSASYPYSNHISHTTTWTGQNTREILDIRYWTDWSGIAKHSHQRVRREVVADGVTDVSAETIRSFPFKAPPFGQPQSLSGWDALVEIECQDVIDGAGLLSRRTTRLDHYEVHGYDWARPFVYPSATLQITLQSGQQGLMTETQTNGDLSGYGSYASTATYPLQYFDAQGAPMFQRTYVVTSDATLALVPVGNAQKEIDSFTVSTVADGWQVYRQSGMIDPLVQQGCSCGCGGAGCTCGSPGRGRKEPRWKKVRRRSAQFGTTGACALSWFGGPEAGVPGTLLSLAVGWFYEDAYQ